MKTFLNLIFISLLLQSTVLAQDDCFCGGEFVIGIPSNEDCTWSLSIGTGTNEYVFTQPGSFNLALSSPELNLIAVTAHCDNFTLPVFYDFCGVTNTIVLEVPDTFGLDEHYFELFEDCTFDCGDTQCTCQAEYTITNDTDEDWFGLFANVGPTDDCFEELAVHSNSSVTFTGSINANAPGDNDIQYVISTAGNLNFNNPDLNITFSSAACDLNPQINGAGFARIVPENSACVPDCSFIFDVNPTECRTDDCTVRFTAINPTPGLDHEWDFNNDGQFEEVTPNVSICHVFPASGTYTVNHRHDGVVCTEVVTVVCDPVADCAFDFTINDCVVTFNALVQVPGVTHGWDMDNDGVFEITIPGQQYVHTFPGSGTYIVSHIHADLVCTDTIVIECEGPCPAEVDVEYCYILNPFTCDPCQTGSGYFCPVVTIGGVSTQVDMAPGYSVLWTNFPSGLGNNENNGCMNYSLSTELDAINNGNGPNTYTGIVFGPNGCEYPFTHTMTLDDLECDPCDEDIQVVVYNNFCPDPEQGCDPCEIGGNICVLSGGQPTDPTNYSVRVFFNNAPFVILNGTTCFAFGSNAANIIGVQVFNNETLCQYWRSVSIACSPSTGNLIGNPNTSSGLIEVFPNPVSNQLKVYNAGEATLLGQIQSIDGRLMNSFDLDAYETENISVIDMTNGIYFLKVINPVSKEIVRTEKIIISH